MIIKSTVLKEKRITINQSLPAPKMKIKMERTNVMPEKAPDSTFQCEIKLDIFISDEEENQMATINLSYVIFVSMEKNEQYNSDEIAEKIFTLLKSMYISFANELLKETSYPPLPFDISF